MRTSEIFLIVNDHRPHDGQQNCRATTENLIAEMIEGSKDEKMIAGHLTGAIEKGSGMSIVVVATSLLPDLSQDLQLTRLPAQADLCPPHKRARSTQLGLLLLKVLHLT